MVTPQIDWYFEPRAGIGPPWLRPLLYFRNKRTARF
jgi:hypothetical protein